MANFLIKIAVFGGLPAYVLTKGLLAWASAMGL